MATQTGRTPEINVTPLIDVLLVLLIIFMVVAPSHPGRFETKVPARPDADRPLPPITDVLVVTIGSDGTLDLNGVPISTDEIVGVLAAALVDRTDRTVIVRAPTSLRYRDVVGIVDALTGAGAGTIGLQVDFLEA